MKHINQWEAAPRKGGGGSSSGTTTSKTTINKDFKPVVDTGLDDLKSMYDSGALGRVAGESDLQSMVFGRAEDSLDSGMDAMEAARRSYTDAMAGTGLFDPTDNAAIKQAAIDQAKLESGLQNDNMAKAGMMGSSRSAIAAGDREAQMANVMAQLDYDQSNLTKERAMWGADSMMNSGTGEAGLLDAYLNMGGVQRDIAQEGLDSEAKGLENYLTGMQVFTPLMTDQKQVSNTKSKSGGK
jgi:hypothetical protein